MGNYNKHPSIHVQGRCIQGYAGILSELKQQITTEDFSLVVDTYPGVYDAEVIPQLKKLGASVFVDMKTLYKKEAAITEQLYYNITDDRVFGKMYFGDILDFIDLAKLEAARKQVQETKGLIIIYGFGARLVAEGDMLVYLDLARWEIQQRYRGGMPNYFCENPNEEILRKYKRGFFIEWRIADKYKQELFDEIDYLIDTNVKGHPKMISGDAFRAGLVAAAKRPFSLVPYFDPGAWGGQWMKEVFDLDKSADNFAWSFNGVPEENSIYLNFNGVNVEIPTMDLTLYQPKALLGEKVYARFGAEFPIRFDFLDTMGGGNLSLQVHPVTEYIKKQFGMAYTQDESYYILDAKETGAVYLGLKEGINPDAMIRDLYRAQDGEILFDADAYINKFPAKKHDHFLIPAGTVHSSTADTMVLEISATPYIFTFKLWDWGQVGLDGKPRPVHIDHGKRVIQWDRRTKWVEENLVNDICVLRRDENETEERTGLHELQFIETRRYWIRGVSKHDTKGTVHMLIVVEGKEAIVESPEDRFEPFVVHYAEAFIVPAAVGAYTIRPFGKSEGQEIAVVKAYVRGTER